MWSPGKNQGGPPETVILFRVTTLTSDQLQEIWSRYQSDRDNDSRNQLILHYMPLVNRVAVRLKMLMPMTEFDDLVSHGVLGLIGAISKFDPSIGAKFESYSMIRIHGAIIDELRIQDWVPRAVRANNKQFTTGAKTVPADLLEKFRMKNFIPHVETLDYPVGSNGIPASDLVVDRGSNPEQELLVQEVFEIFLAAVNLTSERLRLVAETYYSCDMNMSDVAVLLGVTPMRVSQMLKQFHEQLIERIGMGR